MYEAIQRLREIESTKMKEGYATVYISNSSLIMAREHLPGTIQITSWRSTPDFRSFTLFLPAESLTRLAVLFGR